MPSNSQNRTSKACIHKASTDQVKARNCLLFRVIPLMLLALTMLSACQFTLPSFNRGGPRGSAPQGGMSGPDIQGRCVVLALPESGPFSNYSSKIRKGAAIAQQELASRGITVSIQNINTAADGWLDRMLALPPSCAVVGGPLENRVYAQMRQTPVLQEKAVFAFLPTLEAGDEGNMAWRFFPGPSDQIDALIGFATDNLKISAYGAFYANDQFEAKMTALFEDALGKRGLSLQKAVYTPSTPTAWPAELAQLIRPQTSGSGSNAVPVPQTSFQALFLPCSWKNMDGISTALLYNGEDRLVMLGTSPWEQALSRRLPAGGEKFALAVFPSAWNAAQAPKSLSQLPGADFWLALGYDFANFATSLGLSGRPAPVDVNLAAARSAGTIKALAPMNWDQHGLAHQRLYIYRVGPSGKVLVDPAQFQQMRQAIIQRAALRMQGQPTVDEKGNSLVPGLPGASPARARQLPGPLSNSPQPSYKLRLPSAAPGQP